jgi:transcriptional regulator with XRE-family HTH domain
MRVKKSKKTETKKYSDISKRFKEIRVSHNLTQKEFGKVIGLSAPAVGAIENGLYTPNFSVLRILKKKFMIDYTYLIDGEMGNKNLHQDYSKLKAEVDRLNRIVDKLTK